MVLQKPGDAGECLHEDLSHFLAFQIADVRINAATPAFMSANSRLYDLFQSMLHRANGEL